MLPHLSWLRRDTNSRNRSQAHARRRRLWALEGLEDRVLLSGNPTIYTVDLTSDTGAGSGSSGDLLYCITQANNQGEPGCAPANSAGSEIEFAPAVFGATITLTSTLGLSESDGPEVIDGPGASLVTISGNSAVGVFQVNGGVTGTLSGLTISGGSATYGGGIYNEGGNLTVIDSTFTGNIGSGIYNEGGNLTVNNSTFSQNLPAHDLATDQTPCAGGGIYNEGGTLAVNNSTFDSNTGGIYSETGTFGSYSAYAGGGIYNSQDGLQGGIVTVNGSTFTGNIGGGILNYRSSSNGAYRPLSTGETVPTVTVSDSTFTNNQAAGGTGILNFGGGTLTVDSSTISGNTAIQSPDLGTAGSGGAGGGLDTFAGGSMTVTNSTISDNLAGYDPQTSQASGYGGGLCVSYGAVATVTNCTIAGNSADLYGGGIFQYLATLSVINSTISGNSATNGGGGIWVGGLGLSVGNTIIAGNTAPAGPFPAGPDVAARPVTSNGYNLIGNTSGSSGFGATGDQLNVNPLLGPLADNGGPTQTMALLPGSPAIDAGSNGLAVDASGNPLAYDQRGAGFPRVVGAAVDIGAFEAQQVPTSTTVSSTSNPSVSGQSVTFTAVVSPLASRGGAPTGTVTFMDGTTAIDTETLSGGTASFTTAALAVGSHPITAVYSGDPDHFASTSASTSLTVEEATVSNIQSVIDDAPSSSGGSVTLQTTSSAAVDTALQAINAATPTGPVTVTLDLGGSATTAATAISAPGSVQLDLTSSSGTATLSGATVTSGTVMIAASVAPVDWTVDGGNVVVQGSASAGDFIVNGGTVTLAEGTVVTGNSPAIIVNSGTVIMQGATARTATSSTTIVVNGGSLVVRDSTIEGPTTYAPESASMQPTIVVSGGSLVVRDSTIDGPTGYAPEAIFVTGGGVDLGTPADPGGNVLVLNSPGVVIGNTTSGPIPAFGDTFENSPVADMGEGTYPYAMNDSGQVISLTSYHGSPAAFFLYSDARTEVFGPVTLGGGVPNFVAINDSGEVIADSDITGDAASHAFLWQRGPSGWVVTDLGTLGGTDSAANAINDSGQVVGWSDTVGDAQHAFLYSGGVMTDLGTLGGTESVATAINDSGQVVGWSYTTGDVAVHAFLYSNGVMTDLGALGATGSAATAINESGQVTGDLYTAGDVTHAFLYSGGVMTDLGTLDGASTYATAINESGQVIGDSYYTDYTAGVVTHTRAFLYSGGVMTDLGTLGGTDSYVTGINDSGQVIGASETTGDDTQHGFLYSGGVMMDLNDLLPAGSWATIFDARAINDQGQIAAEAFDSSGESHAVLLTLDFSPPAAPSTPVLWPASDSGSSATDNITNVNYPTFTGTAAPGSMVCLYAGIDLLGTGEADPDTGFWEIGTSPLPDGTYSITATATNASGLTSAASGAVAVTIDTTPPSLGPITLPSGPFVVGASIATAATFADAGSGFAAATWNWNAGGTAITSAGTLNSGQVTGSYTFTAPGFYTISLTATDMAGNSSSVITTLTVMAATVSNIQSLVNNVGSSSGGAVTLQTTSSTAVSTAVQAVNASSPSSPVTVTLDLGGATMTPTTAIGAPGNVQVDLTSSGGTATVQGATVTGGTVVIDASVAPVDWTVNGGDVIVQGSASAGDFIVNGGTVTLADGTVITGNSPAITLNSGTVILQDVTAQTATNSPTIIVNGGSLLVRNSTIEESTGYAQAAILITGGSVDLGTAASPGGNTFNVNGTGELVHNATSSSVPDIGNTLDVNGTPLLSPYLSFTALASSSASSVYGQSVTLTAAVRAANPSDGAPGGEVNFLDTTTGANLGSASVTNGVATLITSALAIGSHTITADYVGNSSFAFSLSTLTQTVQQDNTTTSVTSSTSTASFGQAVTVAAKIAASAPGAGTPTGSVDFFDTTTNTDLTPGGVALSSGSALFFTACLPVGGNTIKVTYSGDSNFLSSSASTGTIAINQSIIVLDPTAGGALSVSGNASIKLTGGVFVDSSSSTALSAVGNAAIKASVIDVHGGVQKSGNASFSPAPTTGAATLPDPLASLAEPSTSGLTNYGSESLSGNSSATINPGIYSQISVSGNAKLTLNAGNYIIEGGGFTVSGNASVTGSGVMIFNAGSKYPSTGGAYGSITLSGNGSYNLSPPTRGTYAGIVIFQSRDNSKALTVSGNASGITGTVYAPAAQLAESGNAQLNAAIVVDTLTVSGNGVANTLTLNSPSGTVAYTPAQVRDAYGINNLPWDGTGQTIAIVDAYDDPSIFQALDAFDAQFTLTDSGPTLYAQYGSASSFLTVLNQYGQATSLPSTDPNGPGTNNWELEEALDVEWAHAIAPGAQIILVEANSQSLSDLMASVATAASRPGVSVVSMSWGFAEGQAVFASDEATYDSVFNVPGVTFVASTGDYGAADPEYPAFSPNVVAVGGTSLTLNADNSYNSETGWGYQSDSVGAFIGSGGGISLYEPEPAYQLGVQSTGGRTTPDVSLVADPATGAWIADPYNLDPSNPFEIVGGTSLSAPAWAGLVALVNQGRAAASELTLNSSTPTDTQQALYMLPQSDYNAIASGTNGYSAGAGYNLVTGLGTPVANLLVPDLIAYQGSGTTYSGPTVGPLQNATLTNTGTSSSSPLDVFSVFDSLTVTHPGFGSVVDAGRRSDSGSTGSETLTPGMANRLTIVRLQRATPPVVDPGSGLVTGGRATSMMPLDTSTLDAVLIDWSRARAAATTRATATGSSVPGFSLTAPTLSVTGGPRRRVLQVAQGSPRRILGPLDLIREIGP